MGCVVFIFRNKQSKGNVLLDPGDEEIRISETARPAY
jgi:hypothetical protein